MKREDPEDLYEWPHHKRVGYLDFWRGYRLRECPEVKEAAKLWREGWREASQRLFTRKERSS